MLDHTVEAVEIAKDRNRQDLDTDRQLNLALVRLLEVAGEAAARVSEETRNRHPQIPWPEIISLRNRLIHGYDAVDFDILWTVVHDDLPPLVEELKSVIEDST